MFVANEETIKLLVQRAQLRRHIAKEKEHRKKKNRRNRRGLKFRTIRPTTKAAVVTRIRRKGKSTAGVMRSLRGWIAPGRVVELEEVAEVLGYSSRYAVYAAVNKGSLPLRTRLARRHGLEGTGRRVVMKRDWRKFLRGLRDRARVPGANHVHERMKAIARGDPLPADVEALVRPYL
jgi:hypothetical protein